ncbi:MULTISPECIES: hypothetical protein [unclassified Streptomyces]|uniref:hypothetical protein n=1 Tax=unclassified Streptomyces TaxID=2593676 RepID=UPI002253EF12|nr:MULTISPECIES: hypothetical protein [unclassified Streptomyces]MCX5558330.1 hypothetical protein [Streptomyces sp. NBC_00038]
MTIRTRRFLISGVICALAAVFGIPLAIADDSAAQAAADVPPVAVEDYNYPGAADILTTEGIQLKRGDGHVLLVECDTVPDQITVYTIRDDSVGRKGEYCFQATATTGYLTLELPRVFGLETGTHPISADLTANGATTTVDVPVDDFESVGEGVLGGARSVLVEIRVTG